MNLKGGSTDALRTAGLGAIGTAAALAVALVVQHHRHGWPFSLHHGTAVAESRPLGRDTGVASPGAGTPPANARVPVELEPSKTERIGLRLEAARTESVANPVRAVATVVPDESRVSHVHARVAGWIERLDINTTGQTVKAGQPLAGIFSQELFSSQTEYLAALKQAAGSPKSAVVESARSRLKVLGMSDAEIAAIERHGAAHRLVTVVAPRSGIVLHRGVAVGTAVDPSTEIVTVADLSRVWILAEVSESGIAEVTKDAPATLEFAASGRPAFEARVEFIYPTLTERTRTVRVRFAVPNPDGALRPGLYGTAGFRAVPRSAVTIPRDAVVDTGAAQHVFVVTAPGRFEPRAVKTGARLPDRVEIREGLAAGEVVVASGVFLIDSESRLRASGAGGTGHGGHSGLPTAGAQPEKPAAPAEETPHGGHEN